MLRVSLFGVFTLATSAGVGITVSNRRARALLAMLCLAPGETLERDFVSKLLWPGRFPPQARASLRQCLLTIDKSLDPIADGVLEVSHGRIAINVGRVQTDLEYLTAALAEIRIRDACGALGEIGNKPLFDQIEIGVPFADWLNAQRRHVESRLQVAVDRALAELARNGDVTGEQQLRNAWRACDRAPPPQRERKTRIAVLPFEQYDTVGGALFLAEGVVDELSFRIGSIPAVALVGRTSVASAASSGGTLSEMAAVLDVSHLIEGTVHRSSDGIRVHIRLIDGQSGAEIWSDRYDGTVADVIGSRDRIGNHFVTGLCAVLGVKAPLTPVRRMTADREAYALYLQGRALTMRTIGDAVIAKAIERLEQALRIDPEFAECWAALAEAHLYSATFTPAADRLERAAQMAYCAQRAIALDPSQGHARVTLAVYEFTQHNAAAALDLAFEARRLAPNDSEVAVRLGQFLLFLGRPREALAHIEAAIDRDPVHGRNYAALCCAHLCLGDIDRAIEAGESMADLGFPAGPLAVAYASKGKHERATDLYYSFRMLLGTMFMSPPGMAPLDDAARDAYFMFAAKGVCSGDPEARAAYCQMLDGLHQIMADPYDISIAYPAIYMGHAELVMKIYREQPNLSNLFGLMSLWSDIDPVRRTVEHPGFMPFAEQIGFVAAWEKHGWPERMPPVPAGMRK
jgi:TolB-like protein/tetratricopeptide (TPR) repeat protein